MMMVDDSIGDDTLVSVTELNGIVQAVFLENTRDAIDSYFQQIVPFVENHIEHRTTRPMPLLIDVSISGMFSVRYAVTHVQRMTERYSNFPLQYMAYIVKSRYDETVVQMVDSILKGKLESSRKVFTRDQRAEAIKWLQTI